MKVRRLSFMLQYTLDPPLVSRLYALLDANMDLWTNP